MGYWNRIVWFHERMSKDFPAGEEGLQAVRFLRSFFERMGCEQLHPNHPLHNRLSVGFEPNSLWLVQYARKLLTASYLSGFEQVAKRLIDPRDYLAAHNEIEVALKLHLEGLYVSFLRTSSQRTPDLILRIGDDTIRVEVSSLNPPDEETRIQRLLTHITLSCLQNGVVSGGIINKIPSHDELEKVIKGVNDAIDRIKKKREVEKLNFPGVATIYLAPRDMVDLIPEDCRSSYHFTQPHRRSIEEKIQRKIKEKSEQLFGDEEPGLLFLNTQMINRQMVSQLFKREMDDIAVTLATYPKLFGLVLTVPHLGIEVASALRSEALQKGYKKHKVFLESEAGVYQYESSIIWKNLHADLSFPEEILHALENYPSNLTNLRSPFTLGSIHSSKMKNQ